MKEKLEQIVELLEDYIEVDGVTNTQNMEVSLRPPDEVLEQIEEILNEDD